MSQNKLKIGIVGGAGYTAGELLRILVHHPQVEIAFAHSKSHAHQPVTKVHSDLLGDTELVFTDSLTTTDVVFLCLGHGQSRAFLEAQALPGNPCVIDLSHDFRNEPEFGTEKFIYGLPEVNGPAIRKARYIANPGCFATAIQLALLPLASEGLLSEEIHISGLTGSTGAGQNLSETSHFSWRNNNISTYKVFDHQHLEEIGQTLHRLQPSEARHLWFVPYRGNFTRGIWITAYTEFSGTTEEARELFHRFYRQAPFVHLTEETPHLKQVVNTNKCLLHVEVKSGRLIISSLIDNLTKGASGQAVQNMNLMMGLDETAGLHLKPSAF
jgi:N-acetyl-gamma-glutamyl-phosphate reductase